MDLKFTYRVILFTILSMALVGAATFISDKSVVSPTGFYTNVTTNNINLEGFPLVITNVNDNRIVSIMNADANLSEQLIASSNSSMGNLRTTFLGDVTNIDNINLQSRFKEINLNNGTFAAAGFTAENNLGHNIAFGIGSSNFVFAGIPFPNEAAIFHDSPGKFNMANSHKVGWNWRANELNESLNFSFMESMQLSPEGNLNINGNYTGESIQLSGFEPKYDCTIDKRGTILYEQNGTKGDFFGCIQLNNASFSWKKLS